MIYDRFFIPVAILHPRDPRVPSYDFTEGEINILRHDDEDTFLDTYTHQLKADNGLAEIDEVHETLSVSTLRWSPLQRLAERYAEQGNHAQATYLFRLASSCLPAPSGEFATRIERRLVEEEEKWREIAQAALDAR